MRLKEGYTYVRPIADRHAVFVGKVRPCTTGLQYLVLTVLPLKIFKMFRITITMSRNLGIHARDVLSFVTQVLHVRPWDFVCRTV